MKALVQKYNSERMVKAILFVASVLVILISAGMVYSLTSGSIPVFKEFGLKFIVSAEWNPTEGREAYGALPFITGTVLTSVIAIVLCFPLVKRTALPRERARPVNQRFLFLKIGCSMK